MKVILVVSGFPSQKEPARSVFNLSFALSLKEREIEVVVLYLRTLKPNRSIFKSYFLHNIEVLEVSCVFPVLKRFANGIIFNFFFSQIEIRIPIDSETIVHCVGGGNLPFASQFAIKYNLPLLSQFIGSDINVFLQIYLREKNFINGVKSSAWLVFNSKALQKEFFLKCQNIFPNQSEVIYRGVDIKAFEFNFNHINDEIKILFLGGFPDNDMNLKGGVDLLDSINLLYSKSLFKKLKFTIGGPNSKSIILPQNTKNQIQIELIGSVSKMEVLKRYRESHIVIIPSLMEGLPNVLYESMSTGNLVIASNVGGIPEVLDDESGILVEPNSPESIANAILEIQLNTGIIYEKAIKARQRVLKFEKKLALTMYIERYNKIIIR